VKTLALVAFVGLVPAAAAAAPPAARVTIKDHTFVPHVIHVRPGQAIVFHNLDQDPHTVTSGANNVDDNRFVSSPLIPDDKTFTVRLARAGTYAYFCKPHQYETTMHGTIVVGR
jgi:plastocyanin